MESGETFVKLAWNPIYLEPATPFRDEMPTWGVEIVCDGDCNGLPCAIDPSKHKVNEAALISALAQFPKERLQTSAFLKEI